MAGPWDKYGTSSSASAAPGAASAPPWAKYGGGATPEPTPEAVAPEGLIRNTSRGEQGQTALEQFGNTVLLGYLPQVQAASRKAVDAVLPESMESGKSYVDLRDENILRQKEMAAENPNSATVGVGTGIAGSLLLPSSGLNSIKALKAAEGAGLLGRAGMAAVRGGIGGAGIGLVQNPGDVEGEIAPVQTEERLKGAGEGALWGAGGGGLIEGAAAVPALGGKLKDIAYEKAYKALGPYQRDALRAGKNKIREIGKEMLDQGVIAKIPKSYEELTKVIKSKLGPKGAEFGSMIDDIEAGIKKKMAPPTVDPAAKALVPYGTKFPGAAKGATGIDKEMVADKLREELIDNSGAPGSAAENKKLEGFLEEFLEGKSHLSVKEAQAFKNSVKNRAGFSKPKGTQTFEEDLNRKLYTKMKEGIESAGDMAADELGPEFSQNFKKVKKEYGALAEAGDIADKRTNREFANRSVSLTDYKSGGTGAVVGALGALASGQDPGHVVMSALGGAVLGALGNKASRQGGNQVLAKAFEKAGDMVEKNPIFKNKLVETLAKVQNEKPEAIGRAIMQLTNDPAFQEKGLIQEPARGLINDR